VKDYLFLHLKDIVSDRLNLIHQEWNKKNLIYFLIIFAWLTNSFGGKAFFWYSNFFGTYR